MKGLLVFFRSYFRLLKSQMRRSLFYRAYLEMQKIRKPHLYLSPGEFDLVRQGKRVIRVSRKDPNYAHILEGIYETDLRMVLSSCLRQGDVAVDVGANIGLHTCLMSQLVGESGQVFAFEPSPNNLNNLRVNLQLNSCENVVLTPSAVSNQFGQATLYEPEDGNLGSPNSCLGLNDKISMYRDKNVKIKEYQVDTVSLDQVIPSELWPQIRLIKIDVEGFELNVLKGAKNILEHCPILVFEFSTPRIKTLGFDASEYVQLLSKGYNFYNLEKTISDSAITIDPFFFDRELKADLICFPKKFKKEESSKIKLPGEKSPVDDPMDDENHSTHARKLDPQSLQ